MNGNEATTYREYLEKLKIEFGHFLRLAESGRTIRHAALQSRKQSIVLRAFLKDFRQVSIDNDKRISQIMSEAKNRINQAEE